MSEELRETIRRMLCEELAAQGVPLPPGRPGEVREEWVSLGNDRELDGFVRRILDLSRDENLRADIESGRLVFRLRSTQQAHGPEAPDREASEPGAASDVTFPKGLITEKQILNLSGHVKRIRLGRSAKLTPLARDAIRQAGIELEREKQ